MRRTNWNPYRAHALRRAFGEALRNAGADFGAVEYFIGHKTPMGGAYIGNVDQAYIKAMDNLSIFGSSNEVTNLKISALSTEVDGLKTQLSEVLRFAKAIEPILRDYLDDDAKFDRFSYTEKAALVEQLNKK
jgi:hypothetical protein